MGHNKLYDRTDDRFKHLIGKKVKCLNKDGKKVVGVLDFAGINDNLHNQFQVTIGRMPVWPVDPKTIKPYED